MKNVKYLIVGGGPAGTSAAEEIRSRDASGSILIVDRQGEPLYSKIVLHKFVEGEIKKENLYLKDAGFYAEKRIDLISGEIISLDPDKREAKLASGEQISYEKLLLSAGGSPRKLGVEGEDLEGICNFYSLSDAQKISDKLKKVEEVVVVGGGFLTIDILESLVRMGKKTTVVVRTARLLKEKIGPAGSQILDRTLREKGIGFEYSSNVTKFSQGDRGIEIGLNTGKTLRAGLVIVAVGIVANVGIAKQAGIKTDRAIVVNQFHKTSDDNIFAAGDLCQIEEPFTREQMIPGNWFFAMVSGKIAGANMAGANEKNDQMPMVAKKVAGVNLGFVGFIDERYIFFETQKDDKYLQVYAKDGVVVGLSSINLSQSIGELKNLLGKSADKKVFEALL